MKYIFASYKRGLIMLFKRVQILGLKAWAFAQLSRGAIRIFKGGGSGGGGISKKGQHFLDFSKYVAYFFTCLKNTNISATGEFCWHFGAHICYFDEELVWIGVDKKLGMKCKNEHDFSRFSIEGRGCLPPYVDISTVN